jgi:glycosyltransferase involved in cell wall biosynthesis
MPIQTSGGPEPPTPESQPDSTPGTIPAFSLVIPVYDEEETIANTLAELRDTFSDLRCEYEIIIVNDGSTDRTTEILANQSDVLVLQHQKNLGYGAALKTGIQQARNDWIVITDSDGTYPNGRIPDLLQLAPSYDMVVGSRTGANVTYSPIRRVPKLFLTAFAQWITRQPIPDLNSGLRLFRKDVVVRFLNLLPNGFSFTTTITLAMLTNHYRVRYEPIDYHARIGRSKIQPIRDTLRFMQLILRTGMYFAPLRVFLPVAAMFSVGFLITLTQDLFVRHDLTERTLILFSTATQLAMFALLADMIDKRGC